MSTEIELLFDVFRIGNTEYPNDLKEHLNVTGKPIDSCFREHSEMFAWYATGYELALSEELKAKEELARTYAAVDHNTRQAAKAAAVKLTEKMVENTVITDDLYKEVQGEYHEKKLNTGLLKAARDAMLHRRDMLIQMGATYRAEGHSEMHLHTQTIMDKLK